MLAVQKPKLLYLLLIGMQIGILHAQPVTEFRVNLAGYAPHLPKRALLLSRQALTEPVVSLKNASGAVLGTYRAVPTAAA